MPSDAQRWNERYRSEECLPGGDPAPFLREVLPLLPRGRALDLATGAGRNAIFLAANGWRVTGIDYSRMALEKAAALAHRRGIRVECPGTPPRELSPKLPGLLLLEADLESSTLPATQFELVLCFNYLERRLFAAIERALKPHGTLVYETYTVEQLAFAHGPRNPEHLLHPNELRQAFPSVEVLFYRELRAGKGIASLLARKP